MTEIARTSKAQAQTREENATLLMLKEFWFYFSENRGAVIGMVVIVLVVLTAILADVIAPHPPNEQFRDHLLQPPAWQEGGSWAFPLGTDATGRDMLSRIMHGARYSLLIGCIVVTLSLTNVGS